MSVQLLDGPSSVADAIKRYVNNHGGSNPTRKEFCYIHRALGNFQEDIDEYIDRAIKAGIVNHDRATDILSLGDWERNMADGRR